MTTDLRFLGIPVRLDSSMPQYAIDLENAKGQRIRIELRAVDEPESDPARILKPDGSPAIGSATPDRL